MAVLTVTTVGRGSSPISPITGGNVASAAGGGGDSFPNTGYEFVILNNGSGGTITVTFVCQSTVDGQAVTNKTLAIPTMTSAIVGPFPTANYNDGNSRMNMTYSGVSSLTVGVFKLTT